MHRPRQVGPTAKRRKWESNAPRKCKSIAGGTDCKTQECKHMENNAKNTFCIVVHSWILQSIPLATVCIFGEHLFAVWSFFQSARHVWGDASVWFEQIQCPENSDNIELSLPSTSKLHLLGYVCCEGHTSSVSWQFVPTSESTHEIRT